MRKIKNKKAVSLMVAYVLLIIIVITLSILVYAWLKRQIPKEGEECEENTALIIDDYCFSGVPVGGFPGHQINITIRNSGLFNVSGFFVRISEDAGLARIGLEDDGAGIINGKVYAPLPPGEAYSHNFSIAEFSAITNIEIEPFVVKDRVTSLCSQAVVNIPVDASVVCEAGDGGNGGDGTNVFVLTGSYINEDGYLSDNDNDGSIDAKDPTLNRLIVEMDNTPPVVTSRAYIEFDTSPVLALGTITITDITLSLYVWTVSGDVDINHLLNKVSTDPVPTNQEIWDYIDGTTYATRTYDSELVYNDVSLGPQAISDLEAQLSSNWFGVGIKFPIEDGQDSAVFRSSELAENAPQLIITYE